LSSEHKKGPLKKRKQRNAGGKPWGEGFRKKKKPEARGGGQVPLQAKAKRANERKKKKDKGKKSLTVKRTGGTRAVTRGEPKKEKREGTSDREQKKHLLHGNLVRNRKREDSKKKKKGQRKGGKKRKKISPKKKKRKGEPRPMLVEKAALSKGEKEGKSEIKKK